MTNFTPVLLRFKWIRILACVCLMIISRSNEARGAATDPASFETYRIYFGTYTGAKSKGIYCAQFNAASGELGVPELAAETKNPTFLAVGPRERTLYAVNEVSDFHGRSGAVSAFAIDRASGSLSFLNSQPSGGEGPCHLAMERKGSCLAVANYGSGSIAVVPVESEGKLKEPSCSIQHHGSSINRQRQEGPHAHFVTWDLSSEHLLTCDLGLDKILTYKLEMPGLKLVANDPPFFAITAGSGPRHLVFHPNGKMAYVINELGSTVTVASYDDKSGAFKELQTISTLPPGFAASNTSAEIAVHPSGKFVYASNRGHDSIAVFAIDEGTGKLRLVQHQSTLGKGPRHFTLDPTSKWLLAENQDSDSIVVFRVNEGTGQLEQTPFRQSLGAPVCAVFVKK
jgi:6-phosphogluconolactonase